MFRRLVPCIRRSMKQRTDVNRRHGANHSSSRIYSYKYLCVLVFAFVSCSFGPQCAAGAAFEAPPGCQSTTFKVLGEKFQNVACTNLGLTEVPVNDKNGADVLSLSLQGNDITEINATSFQYFTNLEELNLASNPISSIPDDTFANLTSLRSLNLAANVLTSLPSGIFTDTNINSLNLSASAVMDLAANLIGSQKMSILDISSNRLTTVPDTVFNSMPLLTELYLSNNQISSISFSSSSLTMIDLSHNSITELKNKEFKKLENLKTLDLSHNQISALSNDFLRSSSVTTLDLSYNQISEIDDHHFREAASLSSLDLSYNQINDIDDETFEDTRNLTFLNMSYNKITRLGSKKLLRYTQALSALDLSNNNLSSIDKNQFQYCENIQTLNLENNQIASLPNDVFSTTTGLTNLYLKGNKLKTLPTTIFDGMNAFLVDLSNNPFDCTCPLRDSLFDLYHNPDKHLINEDSVSCTYNSQSSVFLDWDDVSCDGNLGETCSTKEECKVRNSDCNVACHCLDSFYDSNGATGLRGNCKAKVQLNYPCDMDAACSTNNSECSLKSNIRSCNCINDYYDTIPRFLSGECLPKQELGGNCSQNEAEACKTANAYCNTNNKKCECLSTHYDNNTAIVDGGACFPKIALNKTCSADYQCESDNSECMSNTCTCSAGYHDFDDTGHCRVKKTKKKKPARAKKNKPARRRRETTPDLRQLCDTHSIAQDDPCAPSSFFSCYQYNSQDQWEIHFQNSTPMTDNSTCAQYCFATNARYYQIVEGFCLCGTKETGNCCPHVMSSCSSRSYVGSLSSYVSAGVNVSYISQKTVGTSSSYSATVDLSIIDEMEWSFGDGTVVKTVGRTSTVQHTYMYSTYFELTVSACQSSSNVCDRVSVPVAVEVPRQNLTTFITGVSKAATEASLAETFATFSLGIFDFEWTKSDSTGSITRTRECESGWLAHRNRCIKLITTPADFTTATTKCSTDHSGSLLELDFEEEVEEIVQAVGTSAASANMLVAVKRNGNTGTWQWSSGSKAFFRLTSYTGGDCVVINPTTSELEAAACTTTQKYVCMKDPSDCPKGGTYLNDRYCFALGGSTKSWALANAHCESNFGGMLAKINTVERQSAATTLLQSGSVSEAWMGLNDRTTEGFYVWPSQDSQDLYTWGGSFAPAITENDWDCFVSTNFGTMKSQDCDTGKDFICEYSVNVERFVGQPVVVGLPDLGIPSGTNAQTMIAQDTFTDNVETEVYLFPGLMVAHDNMKLRYWAVYLNDVSTAESISLQIYRPSCSATSTLTPPGCASTRFSTCSSTNPTCTQVTCSSSQYPCYLSNTCKSFNESCTCVSETNSQATSSCSSDGITPTYTVVGQIDLDIAAQVSSTQTGGMIIKVPGDISVHKYDVMGVQFPKNKNPVKFENDPTNQGQQKFYKRSYTGWLKRSDTFPTGTDTDELTFSFQAVFSEDTIKNLSQNLAYSTSVGSYNLSVQIVNEDNKTLHVELADAIKYVTLINPAPNVPATSTDSLGTVYARFGDTIDFTIRAERGTDKTSRWSFDTSTVVPFTSSCQASVASAIPNDCDGSLYITTAPYATYSETMSTVGTSTIDVTISNILHVDVHKTFTVQTEKEIAGSSIALLTTPFTADTVPVNEPVSFIAEVVTGTSLTYEFYVDSIKVYTSSSSSFNYTFPSVGTFAIRVDLTNVISSSTASKSVTAKQPAKFASCMFDQTSYTAATNQPITLQIQCNVEIGAEVLVKWQFSSDVTDITTAVSKTTSQTMTKSQSVTFKIVSRSVQITAVIEDPFESVSIDTTALVIEAIPAASLDIDQQHVHANDVVTFQPSVPSGGTYGTVSYIIQYGDGRNDSISSGSTSTHSYSAAGNYSVTLVVTNGPSTLTVISYVTVYTDISSCTLTVDGTKSVNDPATFTASMTGGNFVTYNFQSSEFNIQQSSNIYSYSFTTPSDYEVTVNCSNAVSFQVAKVTANILAMTEIRILSLKINNNAMSGCIETGVSYQFSIEVLHFEAASLTFEWDWGDNTAVTPGNSNIQSKIFSSAGNFTMTVTAKYAAQNAQETMSELVCAQERITGPSISIPNPYPLPAASTVDVDVPVTIVTGSPVDYTWETNATLLTAPSVSTPKIQLTVEGNYYIGVTLSNTINIESTSVNFKVVSVISGLSITCSTCSCKLDERLCAKKNTPYVFTAAVATGSGASFRWNFGDGSGTTSGQSVSKTYTTSGSFNLTLTAQNEVTTAAVAFVVINVEEAITSVNLIHWQSNWLNNKNTGVTLKNLVLSETAVFKADVSPAIGAQYQWVFEQGLSAEVNYSELGYHLYNSTGLKTCHLTVVTEFYGSQTAELQFYVIERITDIEVHVGSKLLTTDVYQVAKDKPTVISISSPQIVTDTVTYLLRVKEQPSGSLFTSSRTDTLTVTLPSIGNYTLEMIVSNSIADSNKMIILMVIEEVADVTVTAANGVDGNITLGDAITLNAAVSQGKYLSYSWGLSVAPSGEAITSTTNGQSVTFTPGKVGAFIVTLQVSNPVTDWISVNYTIYVMVGISGVSIQATLPFPDAVKEGTSYVFTAQIAQGTDPKYEWNALKAATVDQTGGGQTFSVQFTDQVIYNITLLVYNNASSELASKEVYSLYEVPTFVLDITGTTSVANLIVAKTGDQLELHSNISNFNFITLDWKINSISQSSGQILTHTINTPGAYTFRLDASNKISDSFSEVSVVVQDAITGLSISNCGGIFLRQTSIVMAVGYTAGTDVTHAWSGPNLSSATGTSVTAVYKQTGSYNVTVTTSNYVSTETKLCPFEIQGEVKISQIKASQHKYAGYPVTFEVKGNNLENVNITWEFLPGTSQTGSELTLDHTFAAAGQYTLTVTVNNAVSSDTSTITIEVEDLQCKAPVLKADGQTSQTSVPALSVELSVSVDTKNCVLYTLANTWTLYEASSCSDPAATEYPLSSAILTTSTTIQLLAHSVPYGDYCVRFQSRYADTPVLETQYFTLSMAKSDLWASISGGEEIVHRVGEDLKLNASGSFDPDAMATTLTYSWSCTPPGAVCTAVSAITASTATLTSTGQNTAVGEVYDIALTVSAAGRTSGTSTQKIHIYAASAPEVSIECISCNANKYYSTSTKSIAMAGTCADCSTSATYVWAVTETVTGVGVTIDDLHTTTGGLLKENLVIKAGILTSTKGYTFELSVTDGGVTGFARLSLSAGTAPAAGGSVPAQCTVSTTAITILQTRAKVTCQGYQVPMGAVSIKITAASSQLTDEHLVYIGTKNETDVYVSSWGGNSLSSIQLKVYVLNDYGEEVFSKSGTIQFLDATLTGNQTDMVDYIIDSIRDNMVAIARTNNPIVLVQYINTVLHYLNYQSANNRGTQKKRMLVRELITQVLKGSPTPTLPYKQQKISALKYLSMYPEELSGDTCETLSTEIKNLINDLDTVAQPGKDQSDFKPDGLLEALTYIQTALQSPLQTVDNAELLATFGDTQQYMMSISSAYALTAYASYDEWREAMVLDNIDRSRDLVIVRLKTKLVGEAAVTVTTSDQSTYIGSHVKVTDIHEETATGDGVCLSIPEKIIDSTSYTEETAFKLLTYYKSNPLNFNGNSKTINTKTFSVSFAGTDGSEISVSNLNNPIEMYIFSNDAVSYTIPNNRIQSSPSYAPLEGADFESTTLAQSTTVLVEFDRNNDDADSVMMIYVRPVYSSEQTNGELTATLKENKRVSETKTVTWDMMQDEQWDHTDYAFKVEASRGVAISLELVSNVACTVNITKFTVDCNFFGTSQKKWKSTGCEPGENSIPTVLHCKCNHMTTFGGSILVSPGDISFVDLTQVDIISNPVAIITCSVVLFVYIVAMVACRRMDLLDIKRISSIPLCGKDGSFKYEITTVTGRLPGAGTSAHVGIRLVGEYGKTGRQHISKEGAFQRNCSDTFVIAYDVNLGELQKLTVWHDNSGLSPSWYLSHIIVLDLQTLQKYYFICHSWLSLEQEKGNIQRELKVAGLKQMRSLGYRMKTAMFNSLADKHLWLSLLNRPAQSRFTRVQRATCCVTILFIFIGVNAMWYGLLKKDNSDIDWGTFGWEEIVLAIVTNLVVFPISFGLVFLFKKSRSKATMFEHLHKPQTAESIEIENLCDNSQGGSFESRNNGGIVVPYDIERESTIDSVPMAATALHRSRVLKSHRENTDDSLSTRPRPRVAVTTTSSKSPLWNDDNIMKWPEATNYNDADSRPSTSSTIRSSSHGRAGRSGAATPGPNRKGKSLRSKEASQQLLDELDDLENELKESEAKSVKSSGSKRSVGSNRKASLRKASWGSLEDILHSDDESVAESGRRASSVKRGSMTTGTSNKKFNPRADPRINGNGSKWPKSRESVVSGTSQTVRFEESTTGGITSGLRPGYYSEMTMESRDSASAASHKEKCSLPPWCIYVAYVLCFLLSAFSVIIVILYCFKFGTDESTEWVLAFIVSLVLSFLIIEPLKALLIAVYIVASFKSVEQDEDEDNINIEPTFDSSNEKLKDVKFKPVSGFALLQAREEGRKVHRMKVMLRQFIAYIFYLWVLMVICYIHFGHSTFLLNKYVNNTFVQTTTPSYVGYENITSIDDFWDWSENVLADSLHLKDTSTDEEHAYLLGAARWRLIRSLEEKCMATDAAAKLGVSSLTERTCYGEDGFEEDTAWYGDKWNESSYNKSWRYYSGSTLGGSHKVGYVDTYGGGGYTQDLGSTNAQTLTIIQDLKTKGFIDLRTRAIVIEFAMYSPGTDMTAMVAMLVEFPLSGGVLTSFEIQSQRLLYFQENSVDPLMIMECILFLIVIYSLVHLTLQIRERRKEFFKDLWNWYEMLTTLMTVVSIGIYIGCVVEATNAFNKYLDNSTGFTNFERVAYVHVGMRYLHAWLLFLLMYKVVKQLRFIKFMHMYEKTLSSAVGQLLGTGLIYGILLLAYAQVGYLMYGRIVAGFETYWHTISTLIVMIRGTFDFWPMLDHHPVFSHFFVYSYYAFTYGIMIALVISILTSTYKVVKSQMYYKASLEMQDYEMVEFMMKRFKLWAGIVKPKPAFRQVRFPGLPSISSRSSSSYSSRTTSSAQSAESLGGPEYSQVQLNSMLVRLAPTWQAVLRRFDKIEALDKEEETLVKKAEDTMKDLNLRCRINEFERQHKEILNWQKPGTSSSTETSSKRGQSIMKRPNKDNQSERKAPSTVTGATTRSAATPPGKDDKAPQGKRPLSDQGARGESETPQRGSTREKVHKFLQSVKPSKPAWNK